MAVNREGHQAVLLVVDVQVGVMRNAWDASRVIRNITQAVDKARRLGVPVIWVQHTDDDLVSGSPNWQLVPELSPGEGEKLVVKSYNSAFEETTLDEILAELGATHIVLAGAASNWCIRATAYSALDRGYDLTLIADAHTTEIMEFEDGTSIKAEDIIRELNTAITWLSYPGRKNGTASAKEVDFSLPGNIR
jgi:nicotinamidase-related amidase